MRNKEDKGQLGRLEGYWLGLQLTWGFKEERKDRVKTSDVYIVEQTCPLISLQ